MTKEKRFVPSVQKRKISYGQICFGAFSLFCLLLLLKNADLAIDSIREGLALCAKAVIPSLFPFMVLSELILSGGAFRSFFTKLTAPFQRIFHLSSVGCCALLLGLLCGFPIGARCAVSAYDRGELSREEAEHILLFSGIPSSAFLINAVGISLFESQKLGILLWIIVLLSSLLVGWLFSRKKQKKENPPSAENSLSFRQPSGGASLFTNAITLSTRNILLVCAYVVFFSALAGALGGIFQALHTPPILQAMTLGMLELSSGVSQIAASLEPRVALPLCAFAAGWSGISVHCQVLSVCEGRSFSFRNYFLAKLLQGLLCALICGAIVVFGGISSFLQ